jgi:PAS domain S-box-containing protein
MCSIKTKFKNIAILFLLLLLSESSFTQQYFVKSYTIEDGLPTRNINDACQDSTGIMWFATSYGITKYDGFRFINFDEFSELPMQHYRKIKVDERNILWATPDLKTDTIVFFKNNKWNKISPPKENRNYLINTFDVAYHDNKPVICIGSHDGYFMYKDDTWTHSAISENENQNYIYTVIAKDQKFYLATKIGICIIENGKADWSLTKLIEPYGKDVITLHFENKNTANEKLWVLSEKWLGYIHQNKFTLVSDKFKLPHPTIFYYSFLNTDKRGNVIFGNIWAKYFISKTSDSPNPLMISNGFSSNGATSVFIDREQNIWITDTRGINKINNLKVLNYFEKNGMLEDEVTAIVETKDGKIVLGHNTGISILENNIFKRISFPESKINTRRVQDMIVDDKGNIWFISISLGLGRLAPDGKIMWYHSDKYPTITAIHQDKAGRMWIGADRKLLYYENNELIEYKPFGDNKNTIRKIFPSKQGGILIAGLEGLWHVHNNKVEKIPSPSNKLADNVFSYYQDHKGTEFVGTINGFWIIEKGRIEKFRKNGIEINSPLFFITQDKENNYWLGSDQGVYKWDGDSTIITYTIYNGLAGWETNRAAGMPDSKGRIWVGTDRGLTCFEPDYDKITIPEPYIRFIGVEDNKGTVHDLTQRSTIKYTDNTLVFHFRGISFVNEDLIEYKYKLEGFDKDWQEANQSLLENIKYIGLRPGKYTFCVMAKNFSGKWSEISRSERITITQPYYFKWWFIILVISTIGVFSYVIFRYYIQKSHNVNLQNEIVERKRIAHALSESKQKYHDLVELLPETIFETDCSGKLMYLNSTGFRLFGYIPADLHHNLTIQKLIAPESSAELDDFIYKTHQLLQPGRTIMSGIKKDGSTFPLSVHMVPVIESGKCVGTRGIIIDMTEQKRFEDQLQKNAADLKALNTSKDKFFSIIAHDLRSPFTSFLGFTEILDEEFDSMSQQEMQVIISSLRTSAANLFQLLENLLQWSLLQREIIKFEPKTEFMRPLVENCIDVITITATQKEIEIRNEISRDMEITADTHMLQTIIRNLVSNAIKFTARGGYVQITADTSEKHFYTIAVKDTGIGISPERQQEIFRLDANNKTKGTEGELSTGLGLILCKEFVEKHGGKIWIESTEGKGSTFYFTIKKS